MTAGGPLRIAWASPWNQQSAIAAFGWHVSRELQAAGHEVTILRTEVGTATDLPVRFFAGHITWAPALSRHDLSGFDALVVNFGNHFPFHGGLIPLLRAVSANVAIMHDGWMGHFAEGWRASTGEICGPVDAWSAALEPDPSALGGLCGLADAIVIHSDHYRDICERSAVGPVVKLPLAYEAPTIERWTRPGGTLSVATIGHVNSNKRISEVIRAIGASQRLRNRVHYRVIGPVDAQEIATLDGLADSCGAFRPTFTGRVTDETMRELMGATDVLCCLRHPLTEGGSASLITCLLSGRPTIVSDHGSFGEVPDGLVLKCPPGAEAAHVVRHLEGVLDDPDGALAMGERARAYALRVHHPKAYAEGLLDLLTETMPATPLLRAAREVGRTLGEFGMASGDPAIARMAEVLAMGTTLDG